MDFTSLPHGAFTLANVTVPACLVGQEGDLVRTDMGIAAGRIAAPGELSETVQYLCSDAASFMTGQIMTVDGGRTLLDPVTAPAH